jgi:hypothetical protein
MSDDADEKAMKIITTIRRLAVALPLLSLPFVPAFGKVVANLAIMAALHSVAVQ